MLSNHGGYDDFENNKNNGYTIPRYSASPIERATMDISSNTPSMLVD